jgi:quercetin dioxygenase-like cupin family protein
MTKLTGFGAFAALPDEQLSEKISRRILSGRQGMIVWWSIGAGVHVEPHSHANEQIVWILKGKMEFRLGSEQRVCSQGDVVVIPGGPEHEAWFREERNRDEAINVLVVTGNLKPDEVAKSYEFFRKGGFFEPTGSVSRAKTGVWPPPVIYGRLVSYWGYVRVCVVPQRLFKGKCIGSLR